MDTCSLEGLLGKIKLCIQHVLLQQLSCASLIRFHAPGCYLFLGKAMELGRIEIIPQRNWLASLTEVIMRELRFQL